MFHSRAPNLPEILAAVFRAGYLYHVFAEALDKKKEVHIVFCDVKKAFDRVWHKGLLYKLKTAGVCGILLAWFQNYLTERYQQVVIQTFRKVSDVHQPECLATCADLRVRNNFCQSFNTFV